MQCNVVVISGFACLLMSRLVAPHVSNQIRYISRYIPIYHRIGCSKTGQDVQKQEKDVRKQEKDVRKTGKDVRKQERMFENRKRTF